MAETQAPRALLGLNTPPWRPPGNWQADGVWDDMKEVLLVHVTVALVSACVPKGKRSRRLPGSPRQPETLQVGASALMSSSLLFCAELLTTERPLKHTARECSHLP